MSAVQLSSDYFQQSPDKLVSKPSIIQKSRNGANIAFLIWIPAFAGMTKRTTFFRPTNCFIYVMRPAGRMGIIDYTVKLLI